MSDTFNHSADAMDRWLAGECDEPVATWTCEFCGCVNTSSEYCRRCESDLCGIDLGDE